MSDYCKFGTRTGRPVADEGATNHYRSAQCMAAAIVLFDMTMPVRRLESEDSNVPVPFDGNKLVL
jgi:hypothetical protein